MKFGLFIAGDDGVEVVQEIFVGTEPPVLHPDLVVRPVPDAAGPGWLWNGSTAVPPPPPPPPSAEDLKSFAANRRWLAETGGCAWNGETVNTDRESQTKLLAELVAIGSGLRADPSPWKFRGGVRTVTNAEMTAVITAARAHIAGAFATEAAVLAAIGAGTITTEAAVAAAFG